MYRQTITSALSGLTTGGFRIWNVLSKTTQPGSQLRRTRGGPHAEYEVINRTTGLTRSQDSHKRAQRHDRASLGRRTRHACEQGLSLDAGRREVARDSLMLVVHEQRQPESLTTVNPLIKELHVYFRLLSVLLLFSCRMVLRRTQER